MTQNERICSSPNGKKQIGIRELGQTPLLLALMCLVFDETLRFPLRRVELYKEAEGKGAHYCPHWQHRELSTSNPPEKSLSCR